MRHARTWMLAVAAILTALSAPAAQLKREDVPGPLQGWISWVLRGHEEEQCSFYNAQGNKNCAWPGALQLSLDEAGGRFDQAWKLEAEGWAPLPGGAEQWPQDVRVDGAAVPVVAHDGVPSVRLKAGARKLTGAFRWQHLPEQLEIPTATGLLSLTVRGKATPFPIRDDAGRLWLQPQARAAAPKEDSRLEVTVHRRLIDDAPVQLITRIQLKISGANREAVLGRPLPDGFAPMSLVSPLPARLDADGRLRVQARSGTWDITLVSRRETAGDEIKLPAPGGAWATDEAWVFEAKPELRQAEVEGAPSLDPQQTELPMDWRNLPAYLVRPGTGLKLVQRRRGDDPPAPDRLSLDRELWLDFDGGGFSARDHIQGTLGRSWRLEAASETKLGRVSVSGADQFLTALSSGGPAGLEVRTRDVDVTADSRIEGRALTAAGWRHDFESVSAVVRLPPGWRLFHVSGADSASPTWIARWTLLDFFLVLIAASAFTKLYGRAWGAVGLLGLVLLWHEPGAPRWLWLAVLAFAALDRALVAYPNFAVKVLWARRATWGILVLVCLPFFVTEIRHGAFPVLEEPYQSVQPGSAGKQEEVELDSAPRPSARPSPRRAMAKKRAELAAQVEARAAAAAESSDEDDKAEGASGSFGRLSSSLGGSANIAMPSPAAAPMPEPSFYNTVLMQMRLDPQARVTTGPGLPYWSWHQARISWRGPVPQGHRLHLWLIPPGVNFVLALVRVALTIFLALLVIGLPVNDWLNSLRAPEGRSRMIKTILPLFLIAVASVRSSAADGFPPKDLLDQLRAGLLEAPACSPNCAESPRLKVSATATWLSLSFDVHAVAGAAVPLPSGGREWSPVKATLDGAPASVLRGGDGSLWAPVPAGAHTLVLEGPLPERDAVQIALPLKPRRVESSVAGWSLHGVREDGRAEDNLQLSRSRSAEPAAAAAARAQGIYPPFLRVTRILKLGLSWSVETRVERLTPLGSAVVVQIPLLPGESVTSSDLRVVGGKVQLSISPQSASESWTSTIQEASALKMSAPKNVPWTEAWRVEPGPLWHVDAAGVPSMYQDPDSGARTMAYRPWPGEELNLKITRPGAVVGQTLTVDQSELNLQPGVRATDASLTVSLRTSRGDRQLLTLPEGSELLTASVDGAVQPLRMEGRHLSVPVSPGAHTVKVDWRQPGGIRLFFRAPDIDLGAPSVNSHVIVVLPQGRWTLFLGGPGMGPVVLFWSLLFVFILASAGLAKTGMAPLNWRQWFLFSLGLTQLSPPAAAFVALWFIVVAYRGANPAATRDKFNLVQIALAFYSFVAAILLFKAISRGLLGAPDMQIAGNGSGPELLRWYLDRAGTTTPRPWVVSVPLGAYRVAMLLWALWLANSMIEWTRWAWDRFTVGGLWKGKE
ncbi:MAG: hypothetical protein ACHQ51_05500 [Elusimicrobiota bacterium]